MHASQRFFFQAIHLFSLILLNQMKEDKSRDHFKMEQFGQQKTMCINLQLEWIANVDSKWSYYSPKLKFSLIRWLLTYNFFPLFNFKSRSKSLKIDLMRSCTQKKIILLKIIQFTPLLNYIFFFYFSIFRRLIDRIETDVMRLLFEQTTIEIVQYYQVKKKKHLKN